MFRYREKTALITGASSGIGESFARALAARGMNLILVARSEERLHTLADELSRQYGIKADVIATSVLTLTQKLAFYNRQEERNRSLLHNCTHFGYT